MYVRCKLCNMKEQTIQKIPCNFCEKIQNFTEIKIPVATFNSNGTPFLEEKEVKHITSRNFKFCRKNCKSTCTSFLGHLNNSGKYSPLYDFCTFFFISSSIGEDWMKKTLCIVFSLVQPLVLNLNQR